MSNPVHYLIQPSHPEAHLFSVELHIANPDPRGQQLTLPAWIPGSYMIRDFSRQLQGVRASSEGETVSLHRLDKQTWQAEGGSGELTIHYQVYAWDLSVRSAHLDTTHGFFNGTSVFLRVVGQEHLAPAVSLQPPACDSCDDWRVATTLPPVAVDNQGFGDYRADDYAHLVDCPVEMGHFSELEFIAADVPHTMVISGRHRCDMARLRQDLRRICETHVSLFGELPVDRYLFLTMAVGDGYGGLEHRDSTSLLCKRDDLPQAGMDEPTEGYRQFMGLCSHEYFHLWNVKRIRPKKLQEADLSAEVHTELLWAFEGITSYYDDLALARAGCIAPESYLQLFAETVTRVMRGAGRLKQSIAESSYDAWTKFYKQDENAPNAIVSYYAKGALVAFGLDVTLRERSADRVDLDGLMRALWQRHGKPDIGITEDGIERLAAELAGCSLDDFFQAYVHGCDELPLQHWLAYVGIGMRLRPATGPDDKGGRCTPDEQIFAKPVIGARYRQQGDLVELTNVFDGGAAQAAGLSPADKLIAFDGLQPTAGQLAAMVASVTPGESRTVYLFRRDELMRVELTPRPAPADTCDLWLLADDEVTPEVVQRRHRWLSSPPV